jgi:hypothetical protein
MAVRAQNYGQPACNAWTYFTVAVQWLGKNEKKF